jgi:hypothetical protein
MQRDACGRGNALTHAPRCTFADWLLQKYEGEERVWKVENVEHKGESNVFLGEAFTTLHYSR